MEGNQIKILDNFTTIWGNIWKQNARNIWTAYYSWQKNKKERFSIIRTWTWNKKLNKQNGEENSIMDKSMIVSKDKCRSDIKKKNSTGILSRINTAYLV